MKAVSTIKSKFLDSLKRGTGEACLLTKEYPDIDFSEHMIKGVVKNHAYDGQCEGSRAPYLFELIATSHKQDKIRKAILEALATEQDDTWTLTQLFALAKLYAMSGDQEAKKAIYARFLNNPIEGSDWVGSDEILELDGQNGLFYIAEQYGKALEQKPNNWQDDMIIRHFLDDNPGVDAWSELEKESSTNKYIRLYLDSLKSHQDYGGDQLPTPPAYANIIDEIAASKRYLSYLREKQLGKEDLLIIAERLITETEVRQKEKLLHVFRQHKFPLDSEYVLKLAKQKPSRTNRLYEFALDALVFLKSENIREFALEKMAASRYPEVFAGILISNFKEGDEKRLAAIAETVRSEHRVETLTQICIRTFKQYPTKDCKLPLEILYSKTNCGTCRHSLIKILIENNVLSDELRAEIRYDCNVETRELV